MGNSVAPRKKCSAAGDIRWRFALLGPWRGRVWHPPAGSGEKCRSERQQNELAQKGASESDRGRILRDILHRHVIDFMWRS